MSHIKGDNTRECNEIVCNGDNETAINDVRLVKDMIELRRTIKQDDKLRLALDGFITGALISMGLERTSKQYKEITDALAVNKRTYL